MWNEGYYCELKDTIVNWRVLLWIEGYYWKLKGSFVNWRVLSWIEEYYCELKGTIVNWRVLMWIEGYYRELKGTIVNWRVLMWIEGYYCELKGTIVNRACHSINGGSLEITSNIPLRVKHVPITGYFFNTDEGLKIEFKSLDYGCKLVNGLNCNVYSLVSPMQLVVR